MNAVRRAARYHIIVEGDLVYRHVKYTYIVWYRTSAPNAQVNDAVCATG